MARTLRHTEPASSAETLGTVGFACFFTWYLFVFFGAFAYLPESTGTTAHVALQALGFVLIYLLSRILHTQSSRITALNRTPAFLAAACLCGSLPAAAFFASGFVNVPLWLHALCAAPASLCAMVFLISWEDACGRIEGCSCLRCMCFSLGGGIVSYLLLRNLCAGNGAWVVCIALLAVSAVALRSVQANCIEPAAPVAALPDRPSLDRRIATLGFAANCAFGLVWALFSSVPAFNLNIMFGTSSVAVLLISYLLFEASFKMRNTISLFMRICITGIAVGLLAPLFAGPTLQAVCFSFAIAIWFMHWATVDTLLIQHARNVGVAPAAYLAPSKTACNGGFALGWLCGLAALVLADFGISALWSMAAVGLATIVAILCFIPFLQAGQTQGETGVIRAPQPIPHEVKLAQAAKLHGLTAREQEVLDHLLKGRSAQAIANTLVLSEHTVRTHIYNIYKKAQVHSREQLIEHVDAITHDPLDE